MVHFKALHIMFYQKFVCCSLNSICFLLVNQCCPITLQMYSGIMANKNISSPFWIHIAYLFFGLVKHSNCCLALIEIIKLINSFVRKKNDLLVITVGKCDTSTCTGGSAAELETLAVPKANKYKLCRKYPGTR